MAGRSQHLEPGTLSLSVGTSWEKQINLHNFKFLIEKMGGLWKENIFYYKINYYLKSFLVFREDNDRLASFCAWCSDKQDDTFDFCFVKHKKILDQK